MRRKVKSCALVFCLFTFLWIVLGGGLRLNPGGAFLAAATGTPLLICVFNSWMMRSRGLAIAPRESEVGYDSDEPAVADRRR